jgi:hypothetical protein
MGWIDTIKEKFKERDKNKWPPDGAIPVVPPPPKVKVTSDYATSDYHDKRVRIQVPEDIVYRPYVSGSGSGGEANHELLNNGGIVFPYTPSITFSHAADYTEQRLTHSNFNVNFYQRSYVSTISIQARFTVQNDKDAGVFLATQHLLRVLTKMQTGGGGPQYSMPIDRVPGAPPPVCLLKAYGMGMLDDVPIVIKDFKVELPNDVDYYSLELDPLWGSAFIPTITTISVTCLPMYSRREMQTFTFNSMLGGVAREKGFL